MRSTSVSSRSVVAAGALVNALSLAGCGGRTEALSSNYSFSDAGASAAALSIPTVDVSPDVKAACAAQAEALCTLRDQCTDGYANKLTYGSPDACLRLSAAACEANMTAIGTANTTEHINGCAAAYPTESCTAWWDGESVAACRALQGARSTGEPCAVNSQCSSGFCLRPMNEECGLCAPMPQAGDACESSSNCIYGMACPLIAPALVGVCTVRGGVGDSCSNALPCQGGLACIGSSTSEGRLGQCEVGQTAIGAACDTEVGPGCDGEQYLFCSFGSCQKESVAGPGELCGTLAGVAEVRCAAGAVCIFPSEDGPGTCVAAAADGEPCDLVAGPPCLSPSKCVSASGPEGTSGTCVFPDPARCG
jgi:hypothetical protein